MTAGLVEEFYYRGLLRHIIGTGWIRSCLFVACSVLLFGPPHLYGGSVEVAYAMGYGLCFALSYLACGNLWPVIVGHVLIDLGWLS